MGDFVLTKGGDWGILMEMKKFFISICFVICFAALGRADLALPGEFEPVLARAKFTHQQTNITIEKTYDKEAQTVLITATDATGRQLWQSEPLGSEEKLFTYQNQPTSLLIKDIDSDGIKEIIVAAGTGPDASVLYVFKFRAYHKTFTPMDFAYEGHDFSRSFLVSDIRDYENKDIILADNGNIRALGKIYSEAGGARPGLYYFIPDESKYLCIKTEELP